MAAPISPPTRMPARKLPKPESFMEISPPNVRELILLIYGPPSRGRPARRAGAGRDGPSCASLGHQHGQLGRHAGGEEVKSPMRTSSVRSGDPMALPIAVPRSEASPGPTVADPIVRGLR